MQQFQVPQFITVEDKVIGPFTIKQFAFIAGGGLLILFLRTIFEGLVLYILIVAIGSSVASLAFLKINDQSLPLIIKNAFQFYFKPRLYVWKHEGARRVSAKPSIHPEATVKSLPKMSVSKINDLAWSLDIKEKNTEEQG